MGGKIGDWRAAEQRRLLAAVARDLPNYELIEAHRGGARMVSYLRPTRGRCRRLIEVVTLQPGRRRSWPFRALFWCSIAGVARPEGAAALPLGSGSLTEPEGARLESEAERLARVEAEAVTFFEAFERQVLDVERFFDSLGPCYQSWYQEVGSTMPAESFEHVEGHIPALEDFRRYLDSRGRLEPSWCGRKPLWIYWHQWRLYRSASTAAQSV